MTSHPRMPPPVEPQAQDLLGHAAAILAREAARLASSAPGASFANGVPGTSAGLDPAAIEGAACPATGARLPAATTQPPDLRKQAHELMADVFAALGMGAVSNGPHLDPSGMQGPSRLIERTCPITKAAVLPTFDKDALRRRAHEFIDTLLVTFREATDEDGVVPENRVPLIQCASPTAAGSDARATLVVSNDEPTPSEVSLYCTNFVADCGYEIPSMRVSASPRVLVMPPKSQASFEIKIAVPPQAPSGTYSGLLQLMGSKYVKAVLSVQVI